MCIVLCRLVLSAASEYFSAMFTGALREAGESEITLGDVDGDALYALVQYCYTGTIGECWYLVSLSIHYTFLFIVL